MPSAAATEPSRRDHQRRRPVVVEGPPSQQVCPVPPQLHPPWPRPAALSTSAFSRSSSASGILPRQTAFRQEAGQVPHATSLTYPSRHVHRSASAALSYLAGHAFSSAPDCPAHGPGQPERGPRPPLRERGTPSLHRGLKEWPTGLHTSTDLLLFDEDERGPGDDLRLHFEATSRLSDDERHIVRELIDAFPLKDLARRWATVG